MTDRLTNTEKATRYTAVFEFEGEAPAVHVNCGWLGGRLVAVSFCDELARIDFADALLAAAGEKEPGPGEIDKAMLVAHNESLNARVRELEAVIRTGKADNERLRGRIGEERQRAIAAESKLAACERERAALGSKVVDLEVTGERRESINRGLKHEIGMLAIEIAALKRRLEPLTLKEVGGVNNPIIYGSRPLTGDEITAIVADADHIRARRA